MSWITLQWGKDIQRPWLMVWRLSTHQTDAIPTELKPPGGLRSPPSSKCIFLTFELFLLMLLSFTIIIWPQLS